MLVANSTENLSQRCQLWKSRFVESPKEGHILTATPSVPRSRRDSKLPAGKKTVGNVSEKENALPL